MIPPEYFYQLLYENFAEPKSVWLCAPKNKLHEKDLNFFQNLGENPLRGHVVPTYVIYDQEPLLASAISTYKHRLTWVTRKGQHAAVERLTFGELFGCWAFSSMFPVCCHSEKNSAEIASAAEHLAIPCYYWYHAFVARDWYRYWQHHHGLRIKDKSQAPYRFLLYARDFTGTREYRKSLINHLQHLKASIAYNWTGTNTVPSSHSAVIVTDDADLAGIHLVAETLFETSKIQLTEKIFKPMVMSQPFIIWSAPGTLAYLRDYGFRTFDHVWSEDYDLETDHDRRMHMLIDLVKSIAAMPADQYQSLYQQCLPVIEHNRKRFYSQEFMDHCWHELEGNWQQAVSSREQLMQELPGGQFIHLLHENPDLASFDFYNTQLANLIANMDAKTRAWIPSRYPEFSDLV